MQKIYDVDINGNKKMSREGKIHLVESYSGPRSAYKNVTNDEKFKSLKEAAQKLHEGKSRLAEATTINKMKKVLVETKIDEDVQKRVLDGLQEAGANIDDVEIWQFPISKINTKEEPNLNGRVYNKKLWENVVNNQVDVWKGGCGLANHPADDEDGDFMKQSIVWLDGFVGDDGIVYGIGTFVGEGGALARQIISVGGRVGFSTSGYGDFLSDGITVDPDDYEIDRFADLVLNPSQGVYGDYRDTMKVTNESKKVGDTNKLTEGVVYKKPLKESENPINECDEAKNETEEDAEEEEISLTEQLVLNHYVEAIKEINKESNKLWEGKIQKLEALTKKIQLESLGTESKEKINNQIKSMIESIMKDTRAAIQEGFDAREICEDLEISSISKLANIKEKLEDFTSLEACLAEATKEANKYKKLYESKEAYAIQEADYGLEKEEQVESLNKEIGNLKKSLKESNATKKELQTKLEKTEKANKDLDKGLKEAYAKIDSFGNNTSKAHEYHKKVITEKVNLESQVKDLTAKLEEATEKKNELIAAKRSLIGKNRQLTEQYAELKKLFEDAENTIKLLQAQNKHTKAAFAESKSKAEELHGKLLNAKTDKVKLMLENRKVVKANKELSENFEDLKEENEVTRSSLKAFRERARARSEEARKLKENLAKEQSEKITLQEEANKKATAERKAKAEAAKEERLSKVRARLQEKFDKEQEALKEAEFYDEDTMFNDTEGVSTFLDDYDVAEEDRADYDGVTTIADAKRKMIFSNELLDDEAEEERNQIRAPEGEITTLADMFK